MSIGNPAAASGSRGADPAPEGLVVGAGVGAEKPQGAVRLASLGSGGGVTMHG